MFGDPGGDVHVDSILRMIAEDEAYAIRRPEGQGHDKIYTDDSLATIKVCGPKVTGDYRSQLAEFA